MAYKKWETLNIYTLYNITNIFSNIVKWNLWKSFAEIG